MHLWSCSGCKFEIIFVPPEHFNLTFKHKPRFHAKANFGDIIFQLLKYTRQLLFPVCYHNFL